MSGSPARPSVRPPARISNHRTRACVSSDRNVSCAHRCAILINMPTALTTTSIESRRHSSAHVRGANQSIRRASGCPRAPKHICAATISARGALMTGETTTTTTRARQTQSQYARTLACGHIIIIVPLCEHPEHGAPITLISKYCVQNVRRLKSLACAMPCTLCYCCWAPNCACNCAWANARERSMHYHI